MEAFQLKPFEPVELTDDDLRSFGLSEEEMKGWRELYSDPANSPWDVVNSANVRRLVR